MPSETVLIVEDDEAVRRGLSVLLRSAGFAVEAYPSATAFLAGCRPHRQGCLLLDVRMPEMSGLELQQELNARGWRIPTIFITGHGSVAMAIAAMKAGAFDLIEKPPREEALLDSIRRALSWEERRREEHFERAEITERARLLTPRERQVLDMVAAGEPNKIIARRLGISFRTVELHRSHILGKMQAQTLAELIRMALLLKQRMP